jgi:L-lactate dehydrogenase complex protein LldG
MTSSRERILGRIRFGTGASQRTADDIAALEARVKSPVRGIIPERTQVSGQALADLFVDRAEVQGNTVKRVSSPGAALEEVRDFLRQNNLPARVVLSPSDALNDLGLEEASDLEVRKGAAVKEDVTSVTPVFCAVAETGTMVTRSGNQTPSSLNFVPENHVVIVRSKDLVGAYEDSWDRVRDKAMPRTVNWLSGPSRSGDIAMTMFMGAHGPRRQHVILIEDE